MIPCYREILMAQTLSRPASDAPLYDTDFVLWIEGQVRLLRSGRLDALDFENVAEELASIAKRERRSLREHLAVIQAQLLKLRFQPEARNESWLRSVSDSRAEIEDILEDSPSLRPELPGLLAAEYPTALAEAVIDTGLPRSAFPADPPFALEEVLDRPIEEL